jgi:hypothetical protein
MDLGSSLEEEPLEPQTRSCASHGRLLSADGVTPTAGQLTLNLTKVADVYECQRTQACMQDEENSFRFCL